MQSSSAQQTESENAPVDLTAEQKPVGNSYYRWQQDRQPVIERNAEQQKIFDEYFVIKNEIHKNKYFLIIGAIAALIGVVLVLSALAAGVALLIVGIIIFLVGAVLLVLYFVNVKTEPKTVMTDEEYEHLVEERIKLMDVRKMGLEKLELDEEEIKEVEPIVIRDKDIIGSSLKVFNSDNKALHSSTQYVILLFFTDEQLLVYKLQFDMCCNLQIELTSEFFYKDICDVSSHEQRNVLAIGEDKFEYSTITFNIISSNSEIGFTMDGESERYNSVLGMKQKIREMKLR